MLPETYLFEIARPRARKRSHGNKTSDETHLPLVFAALLLALVPAVAQDWPPKTVRIMVPFGAGSTPDIVARLIGENLQQKYPASAFVVENKPGAGGNTGTDAVAKAEPDGATIGVSIGGAARDQHAPVLQAALRSEKGHRGGDAARHHAERACGLDGRSASIRSPSWSRCSSASRANTISARSATARCRICRWRRSCRRAGARWCMCPTRRSPAAMTALLRNDVQMAVPARDLGHAACRVRQGENPCGVAAEALAVPAR